MIKNLVIKILSIFFIINKKKIIFFDSTPFSGSNVKILYDRLNADREDLILVYFRLDKVKGLKAKIRKFIQSNTANIIVTSHGPIKYKSKQKSIELWHGMPLKRMKLLDNCEKDIKNDFGSSDIIMSTSDMYTTLLNACVGQKDKYVITGLPRNDYLCVNENLKHKILDGLEIPKNKKILIFMPTYRKGNNKIETNLNRDINVFGFNGINVMKELDEYLQTQDLHLIIKLHPFEEKIYQKSISSLNNISLINTSQLENMEIDIYQILSISDLLITDYSSVYFDYLLIDKPIVFINTDIKEYSKKRGFLLSPYEYWTPGPKIESIDQLILEVDNLLNNRDYYKDSRASLKEIVHQYKDFNSTERVIEELFLLH